MSNDDPAPQGASTAPRAQRSTTITATTPSTTPSTTEARIRARCQALADLLVSKNRSYGDSALHPIGIFARGDATDLIRVRIDDKLSRIRNQPGAFGEDAVLDLLGYLVLLQLALEDRQEGQLVGA